MWNLNHGFNVLSGSDKGQHEQWPLPLVELTYPPWPADSQWISHPARKWWREVRQRGSWVMELKPLNSPASGLAAHPSSNWLKPTLASEALGGKWWQFVLDWVLDVPSASSTLREVGGARCDPFIIIYSKILMLNVQSSLSATMMVAFSSSGAKLQSLYTSPLE